MADNQEQKSQAASSAPIATKSEGDGATGDPGRTPGKAEGEEQTVEESQGEKGNG